MLLRLFSVAVILFNLVESFDITFWHVTDIHLNITHSQNDNGNYNEDSSFALVKSAIQNMKILHDKPDFIIWNGDNVAHMHVSNETFFRTVELVTNELRKCFSNKILIPTFGNHDITPENDYGTNYTWCENLYNKWSDIIRKDESVSFKKGCYYSRLVKKGLRVIVLNTVLWLKENLLIKGTDPFDQFQWLESQLRSSSLKREKVYITAHVPPGASEFSPIRYHHMYSQYNEKFIDILEKFSDIILAGLFSHQHTDAFRIVNNEGGNPAFPLLISPSVSPFHLSHLGSPNPSIRLYRWSSVSSNYLQYHTKIIPNTIFKWTLEYSSKELVKSLNGIEMNDLLKKICSINSTTKQPSNEYLQFLNYHLSGRKHDLNCTNTTSRCYCLLICGLSHIHYSSLTKCTDNCPTTTQQQSQQYTQTTSTHHFITYNTISTSLSILNQNDSFNDNKKQLPQKTQIFLIAAIIGLFTIILIVIVFCVNKIYCKQRRSASLTRDIHLAPFNGKEAHEIMEEHIENIVESTFADVPEYRGHFRQNSRTLLTPKDGQDFAEKSTVGNGNLTKLLMNAKSNSKSQEKYDYQRM